MMTNEELYALCDALRYRVREVPLKSAPAAALRGDALPSTPSGFPIRPPKRKSWPMSLDIWKRAAFRPDRPPTSRDGTRSVQTAGRSAPCCPHRSSVPHWKTAWSSFTSLPSISV